MIRIEPSEWEQIGIERGFIKPTTVLFCDNLEFKEEERCFIKHRSPEDPPENDEFLLAAPVPVEIPKYKIPNSDSRTSFDLVMKESPVYLAKKNVIALTIDVTDDDMKRNNITREQLLSRKVQVKITLK